MVNVEHIKSSYWYAWKPVKTEEGKWVWLKTIKRVIDSRDEYYLGLLPKTFYYL